MLYDWTPPRHWHTITTIDAHTGGEPLRLFTGGLPEIEGTTVLQKRKYFREHYDTIRTGTMWEPRGHADMYGAIVTEPNSPTADIGLFFLHNEGYSTMCGHAIFAVTKILLETGWLKKEGENPVIRIDVPAGRIEATATLKNGTVQDVSFLNVPSFVYKRDLEIDIPGIGLFRYDIAFGGAYYVFCNASDIHVGLSEKDHDRLVDLGRRIKYAVMEEVDIIHPFEEDLGFLYGTIIIGEPENPDHHSRNVCVFAEGQVDRSATGSGVSARAALHYARNELQKGETITIESILGTCMTVKVHDIVSFGEYEAVIPRVGGTASITGEHRFYFDPDDPLQSGFIFR